MAMVISYDRGEQVNHRLMDHPLTGDSVNIRYILRTTGISELTIFIDLTLFTANCTATVKSVNDGIEDHSYKLIAMICSW